MESYTLIWVRDARSRPVQISIPKPRVKQAAIAAAVVARAPLMTPPRLCWRDSRRADKCARWGVDPGASGARRCAQLRDRR